MVVTEGFGVRNIAVIRTGFSTEAGEDSVESILMLYVVNVLVVFAIGGGYYFLLMAFSWLIPTAYTEFQDLCSMVNISVLIFDEDLQGYYIHG